MQIGINFALEKKHEKARKFLEQAVTLDKDNGDAWAAYLGFEKGYSGAKSEQVLKLTDRIKKAEPQKGIKVNLPV